LSGRWAWWAAALLALSSAAAGGGCADHVQSAVVTCPCDTGVCCTSGVCAANENACEQATQALSSESAGRWTGYIESFTFPSGSDALDLTLQSETDGTFSGQLVMGAGTMPPPPTDPNVGWPPPPYSYAHQGPLLEGAVYHVVNLRWTALRLRFDVLVLQPWGPWCELQSSYVDGFEVLPSGNQPLYGCAPPADAYESQGSGHCVRVHDGERTPVDCDWLSLCSSAVCECDAQGCGETTLLNPLNSMSFDVALRGNLGDGTVGGLITDHNVRLIRASN
jgi:hypothetical protein